MVSYRQTAFAYSVFRSSVRQAFSRTLSFVSVCLRVVLQSNGVTPCCSLRPEPTMGDVIAVARPDAEGHLPEKEASNIAEKRVQGRSGYRARSMPHRDPLARISPSARPHSPVRQLCAGQSPESACNHASRRARALASSFALYMPLNGHHPCQHGCENRKTDQRLRQCASALVGEQWRMQLDHFFSLVCGDRIDGEVSSDITETGKVLDRPAPRPSPRARAEDSARNPCT